MKAEARGRLSLPNVRASTFILVNCSPNPFFSTLEASRDGRTDGRTTNKVKNVRHCSFVPHQKDTAPGPCSVKMKLRVPTQALGY